MEFRYIHYKPASMTNFVAHYSSSVKFFSSFHNDMIFTQSKQTILNPTLLKTNSVHTPR